MPFPTVPLPIWTRQKSRPTSPQSPLRPLETLNDKDGFGIPSFDDPDPFGVLALEKAGLEIREAGTKSRPPSDAFEFRPSPTSPIFSTFTRHSMQSIDSASRHNSKRDSKRSIMSVDQGTQTADLGTQTLDSSPRGSTSPAKKTTEDLAWISDDDAEDRFEEEPEAIIEEAAPTVQVVAQSMSSPIVTRAKLVNIPKRIPPALPPRNPYRTTMERSISEETEEDRPEDGGPDYDHSSRYSSPTRSVFDPDEAAANSPNLWEEVALTSPIDSPLGEDVFRKETIPIDDGEDRFDYNDKRGQITDGREPLVEQGGSHDLIESEGSTRDENLDISSSRSQVPTDGQRLTGHGDPTFPSQEQQNSIDEYLDDSHKSGNDSKDPEKDTKKPVGEVEEFHSVPTTPIESSE